MIRAPLSRPIVSALALVLTIGLMASPALAQGSGSEDSLPSIADKTAGMERMDGMLPLYWDADMGQLWMEIPELDTEMTDRFLRIIGG